MSEYVTLENGDRMPTIGYGTWKTTEKDAEAAVTAALQAGYRHFDTATAYENEEAIGRALKRWIGNNPAKRKELFIVTKLPAVGNRPDLVEQFFSASYKKLGLEYIDMYLIHAPFAFEYEPGVLLPRHPDGSIKVDCTTDIVAVWKEMLKLKASGRVRHVGVSNMIEEQINRLATIRKPECLQVEINVTCQQTALVDAAAKLNIPVVAYAPLGSKELAEELTTKSGRQYPILLDLPTIKNIAKSHQKTPAQILLRFLLQRGISAIPKTSSPKRMKENISVWDFELNEMEMKELCSLDRGEDGRICDFSFFDGLEKHPEFLIKSIP